MSGEWPLNASVPGRNAGAGPTLSRAEKGQRGAAVPDQGDRMVQGDVHDACFVFGACVGPVRSGPAKHDLLGAATIIAIHDSVPRANGASYNGSGLSFKEPALPIEP